MIDAVNRIREDNRRSQELGSSKKHRRLPHLPSMWRPKRDLMMQKNVFIPEGSQKKKFSVEDFLPQNLEESDYDSSVDKVQ